MRLLKKILFWGVLFGVGYFMMGYHYIFFGKNVKLLKKSKFTLGETFVSTSGKTPESLLDIKDLRRAGIGPLLVQAGMITEEKLEQLMEKYEAK